MKYRIICTLNGTAATANDYEDKTKAAKAYEDMRTFFRSLGYIIADEGGEDINTGKCELWIKGNISRNIEAYPIL